MLSSMGAAVVRELWQLLLEQAAALLGLASRRCGRCLEIVASYYHWLL